MSYTFVGGFRLVVPYLYTIKRAVRLAWMGRKIEEVRPNIYIINFVV